MWCVEYLDQIVDHRSRQELRYELGFLPGWPRPRAPEHDEVAATAQWAAQMKAFEMLRGAAVTGPDAVALIQRVAASLR